MRQGPGGVPRYLPSGYGVQQPQGRAPPHLQNQYPNGVARGAGGGAGGSAGGSLAQYLANVLSQSGQDALPYEEQVKYTLRDHLVDIVQEFPSLTVRVSMFTHNDGRMANLLKCAGTAPMYYQGRKYNLPLTIWLLESYPRAAPRVFLTPTQDMIIKPGHKFVDASGQVASPYLEQWSYPSSNLRDLTHTLCINFGEDPPLYSKPANWKPPSNAMANGAQAQASTRPVQYASPSPSPSQATHSAGGFQAYNPMQQQHAPPPSRPPQSAEQAGGALSNSSSGGSLQAGGFAGAGGAASPPPRQQRAGDPPLEVFREGAVDCLASRLSLTLASMRGDGGEGGGLALSEDVARQQQLRERSEVLKGVVAQYLSERDKLDQSMHQYESKISELEKWLHRHRDIDKDMQLDNVFVGSDPYSKQAMEAMSKDLATDDTLDSLEQALMNGEVEPELYLKQIRVLSRKQFYQRATWLKVAQVQAEKGRERARSSGGGVPHTGSIPQSGGHYYNPENDGWQVVGRRNS